MNDEPSKTTSDLPDDIMFQESVLMLEEARRQRDKARASEQRLYDVLFSMTGSLPPQTMAPDWCRVCGEGFTARRMADLALRGATICTFKDSMANSEYEAEGELKKMRALAREACQLLDAVKGEFRAARTFLESDRVKALGEE